MHQKHCYLLLTLVVFFLNGCAPHTKINKLVAAIDCDKTIHFALDDNSRFAKIEYRGEHTGSSPNPDYRIALRAAVEELNKVSSANLVYKDALGFPSDSILPVTVKIEKIIWDFGTTAILMEAELIYKLPNREINLLANNKVFIGGTKRGNVFKTLKHGNYRLLSILCDE